MALNWQHIKGANSSNNTSIYTYIEFTNQDNLPPKIYLSTTNKTTPDTTDKYLGFMVTTHRPNSFYDDITMEEAHRIYFQTNKMSSIGQKDTNNPGVLQIKANNSIELNSNIIKINGISSSVNKVDIKTDTTIGTTSAKKKLVVNGYAQITGYCQADYFNATSDIRAKENIKAFDKHALDIINKLHTYTYTYKNSQHKSYGIMAQDILDVNINGFSFVENAAATGANGDYMSIRESKLVYLLIEGMKEQQAEIEALKKEIAALKR